MVSQGPYIKLKLEANFLIRSSCERYLKKLAWRYDLELNLEEDKHLFYSGYKVTFTGDKENLERSLPRLKEWLHLTGDYYG